MLERGIGNLLLAGRGLLAPICSGFAAIVLGVPDRSAFAAYRRHRG